MSVRTELHRLVNDLLEAEAFAAKRFLEYLRDTHADRVLYSLDHAPEDDEPLTTDDIAAIDEGKVAYRRGDYATADEAKRDLLV